MAILRIQAKALPFGHPEGWRASQNLAAGRIKSGDREWRGKIIGAADRRLSVVAADGDAAPYHTRRLRRMGLTDIHLDG